MRQEEPALYGCYDSATGTPKADFNTPPSGSSLFLALPVAQQESQRHYILLLRKKRAEWSRTLCIKQSRFE